MSSQGCVYSGEENSAEPAQRSGNTPGEADGHTMANLCPYRQRRTGMRTDKTPGEGGCAARDLNPEPAD